MKTLQHRIREAAQVLCVSERTLLPVVVPAIGAATDLNAKLARGLRERASA